MRAHKSKFVGIFDNGRRGNPRLGCDCVQCFGYCLSNTFCADDDKGAVSAMPILDEPLDDDEQATD
jgi:hypothetical protein